MCDSFVCINSINNTSNFASSCSFFSSVLGYKLNRCAERRLCVDSLFFEELLLVLLCGNAMNWFSYKSSNRLLLLLLLLLLLIFFSKKCLLFCSLRLYNLFLIKICWFIWVWFTCWLLLLVLGRFQEFFQTVAAYF